MAKQTRASKDNGTVKRPRKLSEPTSLKGSYGGHKSLEELAHEQGKELRPLTDEDFARMRRLGKQLFRSHKEREAFFDGIAERRRQGRGQ